MRDRRGKVFTYILMVVLAIYILAPLIWIVMMSFKNRADVISVPPKFFFVPTLENYKALFGAGGSGQLTGSTFLSYFKNSLIISLGAVTLSLLLGMPAAYALARFRFKAKESLAFTYLSFRFVPEITIILPLYVIYQRLGLYNSYFGLILVYQLITLPLLIWMMLGGQSTQPVTVGLMSFMAYNEVLWGQMAAATVITILPEVILALAVQRYMIRGLTFGAVK